jgi:hypothetical protein
LHRVRAIGADVCAKKENPVSNKYIQRELWRKINANRERAREAVQRDEREAEIIRLLNQRPVNTQTGTVQCVR